MKKGMTRVSAACLMWIVISPAAAGQNRVHEYEQLVDHRKPIPGVPDDLRSVITSASPSGLVIRSLTGAAITLDISDIEPENFALLQAGRFLGFAYTGYEAGGYILLDRAQAGTAAITEVSGPPSFSPDGRLFAAILENEDDGLGAEPRTVSIWEVLPTRVVQRFVNDSLPDRHDWKIERWADTCLVLSSTSEGWQARDSEQYSQELRQAPRTYASLRLGNGSLRTNLAQPACARMEN